MKGSHAFTLKLRVEPTDGPEPTREQIIDALLVELDSSIETNNGAVLSVIVMHAKYNGRAS